MKNTLNRILLPKILSPLSYKLSLTPNLSDFSYKGLVRIALSVSSPVQNIKLHSAHISYDRISLIQNQQKKELDISSLVLDKEAETAEFPAQLEKDAELEIEFSSSINDQMRGFYRSSFIDDQKKSHIVACTQFEPVDARWAFPCWDEPSFKATFDVDITVPKKYVVLSNMPSKRETDVENGCKKVEFETSPVMSTYLLAWFIGEYDCKSLTTPNDVKVSVYTPPENVAKAEWALSVAHKTLTFFEEYFSIKYPLPKLDMLAINDFINGAMENWGLITYRDTAIYCDKNSSLSAKERVTSVVAHELAHQWFGNLVTMEWWSQLWLNEGFATFMQTLANDRLYPELKVWNGFLQEKLSTALHLDSLESSHPVEVEIHDASEINEVFDGISYRKGASVLRMLYEFLGDEDFRKGVSDYLYKHKYANADSDALWDSLQKASGKNVGEIMHGFTRKQGYPMVKVEMIEQKETGRVYALSQSRFLLNSNGGEKKDETLWNIPIRTAVIGKKAEWIQLNSKEVRIEVDATKNDTVIFNHGFAGFFRVMYKTFPEGLHEALKKGLVAESDRFGLLMDVKAFFTGGKISAKDLLNLLESYRDEEDENVWSLLSSAVTSLYSVVLKTDSEKRFNRFVKELTSSAIEKVGIAPVEGEEDARKKLRAILLSLRAKAENEIVIEYLKKEFAEKQKSPEEIDGNIFPLVVGSAVKHGGKEEQKAAQNMAETLQDPYRRVQSLRAMGSSKDESLLSYALEYCVSNKVRQQDAFILFMTIGNNPEGTKLAWNWFVERYAALRKRFSHSTLFSHFLNVLNAFQSREELEEAEKFFEKQDRKGYEKKLQQHLENVKIRLSVKENQLGNVTDWLQEKGY